MKICTNCQKQLDDDAELCSCGKWFRVAGKNTTLSKSIPQRETPRWLVWVTAIPILILAKCVGSIAADAVRSSRPASAASTNSDLTYIANEINKGLPLTVDQYTRMDTVVPGPGNRLTYYYTLTQATAGTVDRTQLETNAAAIEKAACNRASVRSLLSEGTTVVYAYKGSDGSDIKTLEISQASCGAP